MMPKNYQKTWGMRVSNSNGVNSNSVLTTLGGLVLSTVSNSNGVNSNIAKIVGSQDGGALFQTPTE